MDERLVAEAAIVAFLLLLAVAAQVEMRLARRRRDRRRAGERERFRREMEHGVRPPEGLLPGSVQRATWAIQDFLRALR